MSDFFVATTVGSVADILWDFVEVDDVLNVSVCSKAFAQLPVPAANINRLVERDAKCSTLGQMRVNFAHDITTGLVRRILNRVHTSSQVTISIDDRAGRIILDVGSAFNKNDAFLARDVTPVAENEVDTPNQQIFKEIEISSYDEYDDFNPRHPMMKDRPGHRRGDSLFNSDADFVAQELGHMNINKGSHGFDLSTIAAKAAQEGSSNRETNTSASVKNRILAKKNQGRAGLPPSGRSGNIPSDA